MIVNRLSELLAERNMSIRELSRRTGITYTIIRDVYHGRRRSVQLEVLDAICQVLSIQPGDIFFHLPEGVDAEQWLERRTRKPGPRPRAAERIGPVPREDGWKNW